jgi:transcriptional regulator with XRE-family HTH domain
MNQATDIDWARLEQDTGLVGRRIAEMAGVSMSMWSQVKSGDRNFGESALNRLLFQLAKHFNFGNHGQLLTQAEAVVKDYRAKVVETYSFAPVVRKNA